eukprot:gene51060-62443_t
MGADIPVLGIGVRAPKEKQEANVLKLAKETAALLGHPDRVTDGMVVADCDYVGAGYGLIDQAVVDALVLAARTDGLVLDPVYTGKAMKGLIALAKAGLTAADMDVIESNEAFAAQACAVHNEMGWDMSKVNVNGGAIALGHPIGASGCRVLVTLLHEMVKRDAKKGIASLCIGGGMGVALTVER